MLSTNPTRSLREMYDIAPDYLDGAEEDRDEEDEDLRTADHRQRLLGCLRRGSAV
jgi:hypothetical protein